MSSLATQGLSAAASLTSVMLPHEIAEALRSKYDLGICRIPLTESAVGLFNRPISPMCVQCLFCTRDYDLMGVMYGGRFIFVCPSCGERCIPRPETETVLLLISVVLVLLVAELRVIWSSRSSLWT